MDFCICVHGCDIVGPGIAYIHKTLFFKKGNCKWIEEGSGISRGGRGGKRMRGWGLVKCWGLNTSRLVPSFFDYVKVYPGVVS